MKRLLLIAQIDYKINLLLGLLKYPTPSQIILDEMLKMAAFH